MKLNTIFVLLALFASVAVALPWRDQIALVNSLEVGRNEDPTTWSCVGCDDSNKPLSTFIIEEPKKDVKATLAVYSEYTVLAFRYTATVKNFFQDLLWAIQVKLKFNSDSRRARLQGMQSSEGHGWHVECH